MRDEYRRLSREILNVDRSWLESLELVCASILDCLGASRVSLWRLEEDRFELVSSCGQAPVAQWIEGGQDYLRHLLANTINSSSSWGGIAFIDVLVMDRERPFGFLRVEAPERDWRPEEELFLMSLSDLARQALRRECESDLRRQLMDELGTADVARRGRQQFLHLLSRELGAPLDAVLGFAQIGRDGGEALAMLQASSDAAAEARRLLELLIEYGQTESGQLFHDIGSCTILPLLAEASSQASLRPIQLRHTLQPEQIVIGDPARLLQAFALILQSAALPDNAKPAPLDVELRLHGGILIVWIRDPLGHLGLLDDDNCRIHLALAASLLRLMGAEVSSSRLDSGVSVCEIQLSASLDCPLISLADSSF